MRKLFVPILIGCLLCGSSLKAQDSIPASKTEEKAPLVIKNRLFADFFYSYWLGLPDGIRQEGFNRGVNAAFIYDIPIRKNSPLSFGLGVGVCSHNLYSNAFTSIGKDYKVVMEAFPEGTEYTINKLSLTYLHIPLEFRYFNQNNNFKVSLGVRVGVMADAHTKYVGKNTDLLQYQIGIDRDVRLKSDKLPNKSKVPVEITFHTGWKYFDFNASYMLTKFFEEGNPQIHPFSLGVSIALY